MRSQAKVGAHLRCHSVIVGRALCVYGSARRCLSVAAVCGVGGRRRGRARKAKTVAGYAGSDGAEGGAGATGPVAVAAVTLDSGAKAISVLRAAGLVGTPDIVALAGAFVAGASSAVGPFLAYSQLLVVEKED